MLDLFPFIDALFAGHVRSFAGSSIPKDALREATVVKSKMSGSEFVSDKL